MITNDLIAGLYYYRLSIIKKEKDYCLVDIDTGEWFSDMSIYYIRTLVTNWNIHRNMV